MNQREKLLTAIVACLILGWGGWKLWGNVERTISRASSLKSKLLDQQEEQKFAQLEADEALEKMEHWQQVSLSPNTEVASSEYRDWLRTALTEAGLKVGAINTASKGMAPSKSFSIITRKTTAHGSLEQLTRFLDTFYRAKIIHKITRLEITPIKKSLSMTIDLTVEALSIRDAEARNAFEVGEYKKESLAATYRNQILARDLFSPYKPPRPKSKPKIVKTPKPKPKPKPVIPPKPKFDHSKYAFLSGVVSDGGKKEAWITVRTSGKSIRLRTGEMIKIGLLEAKIISLSDHALTYLLEGEQVVVPIGESLRFTKKGS